MMGLIIEAFRNKGSQADSEKRLWTQRTTREYGKGKAHVTVFCGNGRGKTSAALGQGIFGASAGKSVIIIQFLEGKDWRAH